MEKYGVDSEENEKDIEDIIDRQVKEAQILEEGSDTTRPSQKDTSWYGTKGD